MKRLADFAQRDGKLGEAETLLREAWASDRAEHRWSGEVEKASQLAWLYIEQRRFRDAQETLEAIRFPSKASAKEKVLVAYHWGLLAEEIGDYRLALEQLGKADEWAERVGMIPYREYNEQIQARVFQDIGRSHEASKLLDRLLKDLQLDPARPCDAGDVLANVGWFRLIEHETGKEAENPAPLLERAQSIFEKYFCSPSKKLNTHLNLALAYQQEARWPEARQELEQARKLEAYSDLTELLLVGRSRSASGDQ